MGDAVNWRLPPRMAKGALVLLILNELRGLAVVAMVVAGWIHHVHH